MKHGGKRRGAGAKPILSPAEQALAVADCERESQLWSLAPSLGLKRALGVRWLQRSGSKKIRSYRITAKRQKGHREDSIRKVAEKWQKRKKRNVTPRTIRRYWTNARARQKQS